MKKRILTPEQIAARDARREKFKAIAKQVAEMSDDARAALASQIHPVTVNGQPVSIHNACLLAMQCPAVTIVGGFQQWRERGRFVRKGEASLMIWAPTGKRAADPETGELRTESTGEDGRPNFIPVSVFDVSQTEEAQATSNPSP